MEQAELAALIRRAEIELKKLPGVVGVGYGYKERNGKVTDEIALRVYVSEKKPSDQLAPGEMVPQSFEGIPTDVLVVYDVTPIACEDEETHSPLIGGITVTNFKGSGTASDIGTLGFFATLNGVSGPENVVFVSNHHVLAAGGAVAPDPVYHPQWMVSGGTKAMVIGRGPIGTIHTLVPEENHKFAYPNEAENPYFLDCASARLDICISSWCHINCGVSYKNEIRGLSINGNSKIEGVARVAEMDIGHPPHPENVSPPPATEYFVFKVGRRTSRTKGKVIETIAPLPGGGHRVMVIKAAEPDCDGIDRFAAKGDSGSAVINAQNKLVGLLFGVATVDTSLGFACHIHPVMAKLGITPISTANPPVGPAGQARSDIEGVFDGINHTIPLRDRMRATPLGAEIHELVLKHRDEVVGLINHRRPVTVAWHRAQGPAFVAHALENARDASHPIPREIEGVSRATLLNRMADVLIEHGSPELVKAIRAWRPFVLAHLEDADDLHRVVERLEAVDG